MSQLFISFYEQTALHIEGILSLLWMIKFFFDFPFFNIHLTHNILHTYVSCSNYYREFQAYNAFLLLRSFVFNSDTKSDNSF